MDLSEFKAHERTKGPRCSLANPALSKEDKAKLEAALADPTITNLAIARWLESRGLEISTFPVTRHRRGDCRCGRRVK